MTQAIKPNEIMVWRAAWIAGGVAGLMLLLLNTLVTPALQGGNAWISLRYTASIVLGQSVLPPPATFNLTVLIVALLLHFTLSFLFAMLIAYTIHWWGIIVGLLGGAILGAALYAINFYTLTLLFPWMFALASPALLINHIIFGAVVGGVYESLDVD